MSSDYQLEDTVFLPFTTRAFATGIPTVLAGTPAIDIYEDATATPIVTGETLVVSLNSVVGFNMITVTATAATGFNVGGHYTAIIQAGTVGGVSVIGEVVAEFTIDASAAAMDLVNGTDGLGAIKGDTAAIKTKTDFLPSATAGAAGGVFIAGTNAATVVTTSFTTTFTGNLTGSVGSNASINTTGGAIDDVVLVATTTTVTNDVGITAGAVDDVWDELMAGHVTADSAGLVMNDWQDGGRLDVILDARMAEASIDTTAGAVDVVTLVDTTTANTDMRGTDSALLAASAPTNFGDMSITVTTGLVDITQTAADKVWSTAVRILTASTNFNDISVADILTTQMTESYAANGVAPTLAQSQFAVHQMLMQFGIAGTSLTVRKLNDTTTAFVVTLDDATSPTDAKRV